MTQNLSKWTHTKSRICRSMSAILLLLFSLCCSIHANNETCDGSVMFEELIEGGKRVLVGETPSGLQGLEIRLTSDSDVDIQLQSNTIDVINWEGSIIFESSNVTKSWRNDSIIYSGYNGDGAGLGNEYIIFQQETKNVYQIFAYGYASGYATVTYKWSGRANCNGLIAEAWGSELVSKYIEEGTVETVTELPLGLTDIYIRLESTVDIDIQVYDANIAVVARNVGLARSSRFQTEGYLGLQIQYSGHNGEQRSGSYGHEYVLIKGTLPRSFTVQAQGHESGLAKIHISWGYYTNATSNQGEILKQQLHDTIIGNTQLSYEGVWDALKRSDQDMENPDNVRLFYTRRSEPKENQDNGNNGDDSWNREHVYAKSHGDFGTTMGPGTDVHALRAADKSVNAERSNKDFATGGEQLSNEDARDDCPLCMETEVSFEPPDEVKGDVARMIFYMVVRYNGDRESNFVKLDVVDGIGTDEGPSTVNNGVIGDLASLKAWHEKDPVSDEEMHRNNIIHGIQGNRNPFIDNPSYVNIIF